MLNEFTLVKSKRNKKKSRTQLISTNFGESINDITEDKLKRRLSNILETPETDNFFKVVLEDIKLVTKIIGKNWIDCILCYGLGQFSENPSSLHQLAFLIFLQTFFKSVVQIFDPLFNILEIEFLKKLDFEVIPVNEEGKRIIDKSKITLVFFPHCPKQLVNNFLWANWNTNLKNCIIISNSFSKILERNTKKTIAVSANYISKSLTVCDEIPVNDTYEYPNVFNDTSIHFFKRLDENSTLFQLGAEEPKYLEDTEFITKQIQEFDL